MKNIIAFASIAFTCIASAGCDPQLIERLPGAHRGDNGFNQVGLVPPSGRGVGRTVRVCDYENYVAVDGVRIPQCENVAVETTFAAPVDQCNDPGFQGSVILCGQ